MSEWIAIDGSEGEGGGQVLRSSLSLSLVTGKPFRIEGIRAGRAKPGLLRQHLTAVQAAAAIGGASVEGAELGSRGLQFSPSRVRGGEYRLAVGTAGSATLVLQTVLPALLLAPERSRLTLEGGTHNPMAPPFDFLSKTFLPVLRRMGAGIEATLERHGFYPAGGGRFVVDVTPSNRLRRIALLVRGETRTHARALVSMLPETIAKRELRVIAERLGLDRAYCRVEPPKSPIGPGNVVMVVIESDVVTEVVTGFGEKGTSAEHVAVDACRQAQGYLEADVPVGPHLADQLLIPMALAGGGVFLTVTPTAHTVTNAAIVQRFLDVPIAIEEERAGVFRVTVGAGADENAS